MSDVHAPELLAGDPVLREAVDRLVCRFNPRRIVLFGSRASGGPRADSDYDLLVLLDGDPNRWKAESAMYGVLRGLPASFDILVYSSDWWRQWSNTPLSLERRIETEGRELHAAA